MKLHQVLLIISVLLCYGISFVLSQQDDHVNNNNNNNDQKKKRNDMNEQSSNGFIRGGGGSTQTAKVDDDNISVHSVSTTTTTTTTSTKGGHSVFSLKETSSGGLTKVVKKESSPTKSQHQQHQHPTKEKKKKGKKLSYSNPVIPQNHLHASYPLNSTDHQGNGSRNNNNNSNSNSNKRRGGRILTKNIKPHKECINGTQYVVTCKDDKEQECHDELEESGVDIIHMINGTKFFAVCVDNEADYGPLKNLTDVNGLEKDQVRHLMPSFRTSTNVNADADNGHNQRNLAQTIPYGVELVRAIEFWSTYDSRGDGVRVCIIDTGLDFDHEDLGGNIVDGSDDGDLEVPWNEDGDGHGTHVAGTIAADDNNRGVVGVSPNVDIFIARVFNDNAAFTASSLIDAMNECELGGSNIISMSLGGPGSSSAEREAIDGMTDRGILLVAAAGNSGNDENPFEFPSGYDNVMSVAAVDSNKDIAVFSSHNSAVDIAAPGVEVESLQTGGGTSKLSGTSMATPHVSAVAALLMSEFPDVSTSGIREAMENSATDLGPCGPDSLFGNGLVDAVAAAEYLQGGGRRNLPQDNGGCIEATVNTRTDDFGKETRWYILYKPSPNAQPSRIVFRGGHYDNNVQADYSHTFSIPRITNGNGCYEFRVTDAYNDGTCCDYGNGSHEFIWNGQQLLFANDFETSEISVTFHCGGELGSGGDSPVCGNGVIEASEECDDGNTQNGDGCSSTCQIEDVESSEEDGTIACNGNQIHVDWLFHTDGYGYETSWELLDKNGNTVDFGQDYPSDTPFRYQNCVNPNSCYTLRLMDSLSDGFCCGGSPSFQLIVDGNVLVDEAVGTQQINFESLFEHTFGDGCGTGGGGGQPTPQPTPEPTPQPTSGGSPSSCTGGQVEAKATLVTDSMSFFQNELYFKDENAPDGDFIWAHGLGDLDNNETYEGDACLDPSGCYAFYFFDGWGNGLSSGGLTFSFDDNEELKVDVGDTGTRWRSWGLTTYWEARVGNCS